MARRTWLPCGPPPPLTRYAIDSVSKEFTAAAVLLLAQRGKLSLDDPVSKWFPSLQAAAAVTVRQLLTHTGGIRDYWPQDFLTPEMTRPTTVAAIIDEWAQRPLDFEPGTEWQYSNTGYVLAGAIVEKVSGNTLFEFQKRGIFTPLRMNTVTEYSPLPGQPSNLGAGDATGYTRNGLGPVIPAPKEGAGWLFGAGHLAMQPGELALWDISLLDRSLLGNESYDAELAPAVLKNGQAQEYALGLDVQSTRGRLRVGHSGGGSGFLADNRLWPQDRAAVVVLTNNDWASPSDLGDRIAYLVLPPTAEEARAREIFRDMQAGTVDRAAFTEVGNSHLTAAVLTDLQSSLSGLGACAIDRTGARITAGRHDHPPLENNLPLHASAGNRARL